MCRENDLGFRTVFAFLTRFIVTSVLIAGAIWSVTEATTYFEDDWLKGILGDRWWIFYIVLPVIIAFFVTVGRRKRTEEGPEGVGVGSQSEGQRHVDTCVQELRRWLKQLERVFAHFRNEAQGQSDQEFRDVLVQLKMHLDDDSPLHIQDSELKRLILKDLPGFERYRQSKGHLRHVLDGPNLAFLEQKELKNFLKLCDTIENAALEAKDKLSSAEGEARTVLLETSTTQLNEYRLNLQEIGEKVKPRLGNV